MRERLIEAFPSLKDKELSDEYIESHPDLMWDVPELPLINAVPLYMLWCLEHSADEGSLVIENTIGALNKYARAKDPSVTSQNFVFSCTQHQKAIVQEFLYWCEDTLILDYEPMLSRAIKNWENCYRDRE